MVSNIELEIAMNVIQLIGVTIPVLLGILRYYINEQETIDEIISSHPETLEEAEFADFLWPASIILFVPYFFSYLLIANNSHLFITLALAGYGGFLMLISFSVAIGLGKPLLEPIKRFAVGARKATSLLLTVFIGVAALLGDRGLVISLGVFFLAFLSASSAGRTAYRYTEARENKSESQSKDKDEKNNGVGDKLETEPAEDEVHSEE